MLMDLPCKLLKPFLYPGIFCHDGLWSNLMGVTDRLLKSTGIIYLLHYRP